MTHDSHTQDDLVLSQKKPKTLNEKVDGFLNSLGDVLNDITALEVNTMIVARISGSKFNPLAAYEDIYAITEEWFEKNHIAEDCTGEVRSKCRENYLKLRQNLERHYKAVIHDPTATLPEPNTMDKLDVVFENPEFLRALRKIREQKSAYDSDDPKSADIDLIYAQTVIQLDGDVVNRFHEKLFDASSDKRELILTIHSQGVATGEAQWRGLLNFVVDLLKKFRFNLF